MTCNYCTPDYRGQRKAIDRDIFPIKHKGVFYTRTKRNTLKIHRDRRDKKPRRYFLGCHSIDVNGKTMLRNNGFILKRYINFCPFCGKDLRGWNERCMSGVRTVAQKMSLITHTK